MPKKLAAARVERAPPALKSAGGDVAKHPLQADCSHLGARGVVVGLVSQALRLRGAGLRALHIHSGSSFTMVSASRVDLPRPLSGSNSP